MASNVERSSTEFPATPLGDFLWQLYQQHGDALNEHELECEFSVIFAEKEQALRFGQLLLENGQKLSFSPYQGNEELPWEITAYPTMALTLDNISGYSQLLASNSQQFSGVLDAWYCPALEVGQEEL